MYNNNTSMLIAFAQHRNNGKLVILEIRVLPKTFADQCVHQLIDHGVGAVLVVSVDIE